MHYKRILLIVIVMIFMTGSLSVKAATTASSVPPLAPWDSEVVDKLTGGSVGSHVSIAHYKENGRAYVSYYDATNHDLKLAYQVDPGTGNCPGNLDWKCSTVDDGGPYVLQHDVGQFSSTDIVTKTVYLTASPQGEINAQLPHYHYAKIGISYYDATVDALRFAIGSCNDATVCTWTKTTVDDDTSDIFADNIGQYSSFYFGTDATPIIFYQARTTGLGDFYGYVKHAWQTPPSIPIAGCQAGWSCEIVAQSLTNRAYGSYISADGGRVAFYNPINGSLVVANPTGSIMSNNCGLGNYWFCAVIDNNGDVGKFASLHNDGVNPMRVAYYDATTGKVKYAIRTTADTGNCTDNDYNCFAVDTIGTTTLDINIGISLTLDAQGEPVIAYQNFLEDMAPAKLKLARPSSVYGQPIGNCGAVPPGYLFQYWQCSILDWGGQYQNEADYAAVSVSPAGLATVAYYEIYESAQDVFEGRLKVTQQHFAIFLPLISK